MRLIEETKTSARGYHIETSATTMIGKTLVVKKARRAPDNHGLLVPWLTKDGVPSSFFIGIDPIRGFFIAGGKGNVLHTGHPKCECMLVQATTKLLNKENESLLRDMYKSQTPSSIISNILHHRTGLAFSNAKISYGCGLLDHLRNQTDEEDGTSGCDDILDWFTKKEYDHIFLYHDSITKSIQTDHVQVTRDLHDRFTVSYLPQEDLDTIEDANSGRKSLNIVETNRYLMAFAWAVLEDAFLLRLFPEVVTVNVVKSTNNEKRPLFTMCGKTTHGKIFTIMRVFLPHEKTWIFWWLFCILLPRLFGKPTVDQIKVIISDGDSQEIQQLDNAITLFLPIIVRVRCGWHIIFMGWRAHMPYLNDMKKIQATLHRSLFCDKELDL